MIHWRIALSGVQRTTPVLAHLTHHQVALAFGGAVIVGIGVTVLASGAAIVSRVVRRGEPHTTKTNLRTG